MFQPLDRRTFLKAAGVSVALPLLESMSPAIVSAATAAAAPKRMVIICNVLGLYGNSLFPKAPGRDYESTEYLDLIKDHREDFTLFSGFAHEGQTGREPHSCELTWLTSAQGPALGGFRNSISVDQVAADQLGYTTRFPSVVFGSSNTISQSFTSSGVMVPAENRPARMFTKMFLEGKPHQIAREKQNLSDGRSILDTLMSQTESLKRRVSTADKEQLDEYFTAFRSAEQNLSEAQVWSNRPKPSVGEAPEDVRANTDILGRVQLVMDIIPLILQTDTSRVVALKIQDHRAVPEVDGVSDEHHNLSHHGKEPGKIEQLRKIERGLMTCYGSLLSQLKQKKEANGSLLDSSQVLLGSNLGNANAHNSRNLPIMLAGGGYKHGSYVAHDKDKNSPLCNLFVTMLNNMGTGVETESFGQSTGALTW